MSQNISGLGSYSDNLKIEPQPENLAFSNAIETQKTELNEINATPLALSVGEERSLNPEEIEFLKINLGEYALNYNFIILRVEDLSGNSPDAYNPPDGYVDRSKYTIVIDKEIYDDYHNLTSSELTEQYNQFDYEDRVGNVYENVNKIVRYESNLLENALHLWQADINASKVGAKTDIPSESFDLEPVKFIRTVRNGEKGPVLIEVNKSFDQYTSHEQAELIKAQYAIWKYRTDLNWFAASSARVLDENPFNNFKVEFLQDIPQGKFELIDYIIHSDFMQEIGGIYDPSFLALTNIYFNAIEYRNKSWNFNYTDDEIISNVQEDLRRQNYNHDDDPEYERSKTRHIYSGIIDQMSSTPLRDNLWSQDFNPFVGDAANLARRMYYKYSNILGDINSSSQDRTRELNNLIQELLDYDLIHPDNTELWIDKDPLFVHLDGTYASFGTLMDYVWLLVNTVYIDSLYTGQNGRQNGIDSLVNYAKNKLGIVNAEDYLAETNKSGIIATSTSELLASFTEDPGKKEDLFKDLTSGTDGENPAKVDLFFTGPEGKNIDFGHIQGIFKVKADTGPSIQISNVVGTAFGEKITGEVSETSANANIIGGLGDDYFELKNPGEEVVSLWADLPTDSDVADGTISQDIFDLLTPNSLDLDDGPGADNNDVIRVSGAFDIKAGPGDDTVIVGGVIPQFDANGDITGFVLPETVLDGGDGADTLVLQLEDGVQLATTGRILPEALENLGTDFEHVQVQIGTSISLPAIDAETEIDYENSNSDDYLLDDVENGTYIRNNPGGFLRPDLLVPSDGYRGINGSPPYGDDLVAELRSRRESIETEEDEALFEGPPVLSGSLVTKLDSLTVSETYSFKFSWQQIREVFPEQNYEYYGGGITVRIGDKEVQISSDQTPAEHEWTEETIFFVAEAEEVFVEISASEQEIFSDPTHRGGIVLIDIPGGNNAPALSLTPLVTSLTSSELTNAQEDIRVAQINIEDDGLGENALSLSSGGPFKIVSTEDGDFVVLQAGSSFGAGTQLDFEVIVDDPEIGDGPEDSISGSVSIVSADDQAPGEGGPGDGEDSNDGSDDGDNTEAPPSVPTATGDPMVPLFDEAGYLAGNPDVAAAVEAGTVEAGLAHFITFGLSEGRDPFELFDTAYYLEQYPDVAAAIEAGTIGSAFEHYIQFGQFENRNPSALFNATDYLAANLDVAAAVEAGTIASAFEHYITFGATEGRDGTPEVV